MKRNIIRRKKKKTTKNERKNQGKIKRVRKERKYFLIKKKKGKEMKARKHFPPKPSSHLNKEGEI